MSDRKRELIQTWNGIAVDLASRGKMASACAAMRRAVNLDERSPSLHANYGNMLRRLGRMREAWDHLDRAIQMDPDHLPAIANLACWEMDRGQPDLACHLWEKCLREEESDNWRFGYAGALFQAGRWKEAFKAYESRLAQRGYNGSGQIPLWDGSPLNGRTLMIHAEQGLGDTIMFSRFVNWIEAINQPIVLQPQLFRLMTLGFDNRFDWRRAGEKVEADCHLPLMSLPHVRGTDRISGEAYLRPPTRHMALEAPPGARHKIGLVWKAKANWKQQTPDEMLHGLAKSMPLEHLLELTSIPGAALYGLQVPTTDIEDLGAGHLITDLQGSIHDFADLASFLSQMDVVVSVDTAPAHLAGALGKPTVVVLHHAGSWQWQTGDRTAWYDSVRIVRQETPGVWPVGKIIEAVRDHV